MDLEIKAITRENKSLSVILGGFKGKIIKIHGYGWTKTIEQAIKEIDDGINSFYVSPHNYRSLLGMMNARVIVERPYNQKPYLKTINDGFEENNLENLPEKN